MRWRKQTYLTRFERIYLHLSEWFIYSQPPIMPPGLKGIEPITTWGMSYSYQWHLDPGGHVRITLPSFDFKVGVLIADWRTCCWLPIRKHLWYDTRRWVGLWFQLSIDTSVWLKSSRTSTLDLNKVAQHVFQISINQLCCWKWEAHFGRRLLH